MQYSDEAERIRHTREVEMTRIEAGRAGDLPRNAVAAVEPLRQLPRRLTPSPPPGALADRPGGTTVRPCTVTEGRP